jgi:hypothetical protein
MSRVWIQVKWQAPTDSDRYGVRALRQLGGVSRIWFAQRRNPDQIIVSTKTVRKIVAIDAQVFCRSAAADKDAGGNSDRFAHSRSSKASPVATINAIEPQATV